MAADPSEYVWSSYQINALGKTSDLCTPHPEYLRLGATKNERLKNYCGLFSHHVEGDLLEEIRSSANKGMAIGHDRFKDEIEALTGRRLKPKNWGDLSGGVRKRMVFNVHLTPVTILAFLKKQRLYLLYPVYFFIKALFSGFKWVSGGVIEMIPAAVAVVAASVVIIRSCKLNRRQVFMI